MSYSETPDSADSALCILLCSLALCLYHALFCLLSISLSDYVSVSSRREKPQCWQKDPADRQLNSGLAKCVQSAQVSLAHEHTRSLLSISLSDYVSIKNQWTSVTLKTNIQSNPINFTFCSHENERINYTKTNANVKLMRSFSC